MCTQEDTLAHILGTPYFDDVMSYTHARLLHETVMSIYSDKLAYVLVE